MRLFKRKKKSIPTRSTSARQPNDGQKVFSYYTASHQKLSSYERRSETSSDDASKKRQQRALRQHWFGYFCVVVTIASFIYLSTLNGTPHINVTGTSYRSDADYAAIASEQLAKTPLNLTKITLQRTQLSRSINEQIPEAKEIKVSAPFLGHRPNITVVTDDPAAVLQQPGGQDLIVSKRGRLLLATNQSANTTNLPIITNKSGVSGKPGEQFLSPTDMDSLLKLLGQIKIDASAVSFILPPTPREITMLEPSRGVYQVKLLLGETILQQYGSLRAAQKKLQEQSQTPTEYIDARLADKVFYR